MLIVYQKITAAELKDSAAKVKVQISEWFTKNPSARFARRKFGMAD